MKWLGTWLMVIALAQPRAAAPADLVQTLSASLVHISGYMTAGDQGTYAEASGFFVDPDGLVVSVANVFTDPKRRLLCERFQVRLSDGRTLSAEAHAVDAFLNLLLLSVHSPGVYPVAATSLKPARPGAPVLAAAAGSVGELALAAGHVKAQPRRSVYGLGLGGLYLDLALAHLAGADGAALLNASGEVIGIVMPNVHRPADQPPIPGEMHALPIRAAQGFFRLSEARPLSAERWLGLGFRPLTPNERAKTASLLGRRAGVFVDFIWSQGPAGDVDVQRGDILVAMNDRDLGDILDLHRWLAAAVVGQRAKLALLRGEGLVFREVPVVPRPLWAGEVPWRIE